MFHNLPSLHWCTACSFPQNSMASIAPLHLSASSATSLCMGIGSHSSCLLLVSLPISFPICIYVTMWFTPHVCIPPHLPMTPIPICFPHSMLVPCVQPLTFHCTYIRLEKHVCFASSYINFDIYCQSPTHVWLKPHAPQYLLDSRNYSTLDPLLFWLAQAWNLFPWYLRLCSFPYGPWGVHIPAYNSKYLDHDRRLA